MKVLHAPVNIAGQPIVVVHELQRQGIDASLLQYGHHSSGYPSGRVVDWVGGERFETQIATLNECLSEDYDIFHFWMASLVFGRDYEGMDGLDLLFLKLRNKRIVYTPTGFDVRTRSRHEAVNPYSPFRYGFAGVHREEAQHQYVRFLDSCVDEFAVMDPELAEFLPRGRCIPRAIDLTEWPEIGVQPTARPLVVHAPSRPELKGTEFVVRAVEALRAEGIRFDFKLVQDVAHTEAVEWYKRADIIVDQLLIGWYGVLTVEALALGKPVVVYVRDDLVERTDREIPIKNANPDTIQDALRGLLADYELRQSLASRAREYVEDVHDVRKVAGALRELYRAVLSAPSKEPQNRIDVDCFYARCKDLERAASEHAERGVHALESRVRDERATFSDRLAGLDRMLTEERVAARQRRDALHGKIAQLEERISVLSSRLTNERQANAATIDRLKAELAQVRKSSG